jgi:DNA-binding transcriptional regulator YdaS (Cro superfamily)
LTKAALADILAPMKPTQALKVAIRAAGGTVALARKLGITSQAISQWQLCPVQRAAAVERATNGLVTRQQLRPDIFGSTA